MFFFSVWVVGEVVFYLCSRCILSAFSRVRVGWGMVGRKVVEFLFYRVYWGGGDSCIIINLIFKIG